MKGDLFQDKKEEFRCYFNALWSDSKPLAKLFRTDTRGYIYDSGTNRIFACSEIEYSLLHNLKTMGIDKALEKTRFSYPPEEILHALGDIKTVIKENNILKTYKATQFGLSAHYKSLIEGIQNSLGMVQLEITERCNLRCKYCIYSPHFTQKRNHGTRDMNLDTAYRAIDHLARSSRHKKDIAVTFYGGEPLLRFPIIQACVQYAHKIMPLKHLRFSMTTNATLLTPEIAKYLNQEGFGIHVSLDGPEDIHDQQRKYENGVGSFRKTISGLKMLYDAYSNQKHKITLNMVYAPPYSEEQISRIAELWNECPWLPSDISLNISYAQGAFPRHMDNRNHMRRDFSLFEWTKNNFIASYKRGERAHPIASNSIESRLVYLVQRPIMTTPLGKYHLNGCCIPAVRKLFVSTDGTFYLCERMGLSPEIGNVTSGVDINRVKKIYVKEFDEQSIESCSECWALQICSICYAHAFYNGRFNLQMKNTYCTGQRLTHLKFLKLYCFLLEINGVGLDYLNDWEIH